MTKRPQVPLSEGPPKKRAPRRVPDVAVSPDDLPAVFGYNLKVARLERAMTLADVGRAAGMTGQGVSKVESGRSGFTLTTMKKLADIVGLEVGDMLKLPVVEPASDEKPASRPSRKKSKS